MESVKEQITDFVNKCEEMKNCKFIMATTKIKDLLKSIVNSAELYELFNTVASKFDYNAAKQRCFVEADEGSFRRSHIVLPDTVGDRLAFIFCLLVEFDRGDVNLNAFLQKYYPKDGSYYASYHMFCDEVIGSLESIVCDIFSQELSEPAPRTEIGGTRASIAQSGQSGEASARIGSISLLIAREKDYVANSALGEDDKESAIAILDQINAAVKSGDVNQINALTFGYNYFVLYSKVISEDLNSLFNLLGEYIQSL